MDLRNGMNEVYTPPSGIKPIANIIVVHGLFGGPWKTFAVKTSHSSAVSTPSSKRAKASTEVFWPRDLLPKVVDNVRVFSFGYDANIERFMSSAGLNTVYQHGRNLLNALCVLLDDGNEPIPSILIAHSLGGLVVKEALNQSAHDSDTMRKAVLTTTQGIVFLGTPHGGSSAASYGKVAFRLTQLFAFQSTNIRLMTALEANSETLDRVSTDFRHTLAKSKKLRIWSFAEEKQVRFGPVGMQIVPASSAKIGHDRENWGSISEDHRNIAKYKSLNDDGFVKVSHIIQGWVRDIQATYESSRSMEGYKECLESLDDPAARIRVQEVERVSKKNKRSFEWLYTSKVQFAKWLADEGLSYGPIFWITGKPGSGKSTLMRFALEDTRTINLLPVSIGDPIAYFFHLRGKSLVQKSLKGMLKELLCQLLEQFPDFYKILRPTYDRLLQKFGAPEWDISHLTEGLMLVPKLVSRSGLRCRIILFIDALDENQDQKENEQMVTIFKDLAAAYVENGRKPGTPILKICLASRPWPLFKKELGNSQWTPSLAMQDHTLIDINLYANSLLHEPYLQLSQDITDRAKGVFVWVRVVVDNLRREITAGTPIEKLHDIILKYPEELKDLYEHTINRIPPEYCPETEVALKVLLSSQTALALSELYVITQTCIGNPPASDFSPSNHLESWLTSRSGGLIEVITAEAILEFSPNRTIGSGSMKVQFIHQTVQDFVRHGIPGISNPQYPGASHFNASGHRLLALACLHRYPPHPILNRVCTQLFHYLRNIERELDTQQPEKDPPPLASLPSWAGYKINMFPIYLPRQRPLENVDFVLPSPDDYRIFLDFEDLDKWNSFPFIDKTAITATGDDIDILLPIPHLKAGNTLIISQNLYYADFGSGSRALNINSLFWAGLGPRLSKDRVDRLRMFRKVLEVMNPQALGDGIGEPMRQHSIVDLETEVAQYTYRLRLLTILAIAKPNKELTNEHLLQMADMILARGAILPRLEKIDYRYLPISIIQFCARFKGEHSASWVNLLLRYTHSNSGPLDAGFKFYNELALKAVVGTSYTLSEQVVDAQADDRNVTGECLVLGGLVGAQIALRNNAIRICYDNERILR